ncbi:unnamed protein product, partial [Prorocentrum cordatum]
RPFWETREAPVWAQHMFQRQGLAVQEHKRATMHYNLGLGKPTCRPRAARRTPRPVGGRDACKLPWEGSLWKGVRPGPKRASEGLNLQEEEEEEEAGRGTQNDCEDDPRRELARP